MKMRKIIAMFTMAGLMAVAATGCGNADNGAEDTQKTEGWDASGEISVISREEGSGTRGAFVELFGIETEVDGEDVDMTTADAQTINSTAVMKTTVSGDDYAIGYISLGVLDDTVKAVKIDGTEATAENVKAGTYKVARPFNIAVKPDTENEVVKDFVAFILSTEGQAIVEESGYIPLEDTETFEGTSPSGKAVVGGSSSVAPVMEKLIEAYKEVNANADIELQSSDSTTGMTSTIEGNYDIGMASRELKDKETEKLEGIEIAIDGIAVIVNNENTVEELSTEQVFDIYTGEALTWEEVTE